MIRVLPILFNTDMVRAIQDDRKGATRRIVKGFIPDDAIWGYTAFTPEGYISCRGTFADGYGEKFFKLPCQPGDILYVRETWKCWRAHRYEATADIKFRAGGDGVQLQFANGSTDSIDRFDYDTFVNKWFSHNGEWKPSIFMPKEAARIWLKAKEFRVERLQDMDWRDALDVGVNTQFSRTETGEYIFDENPIDDFIDLWNSTIKKSDLDRYGWDANPWVWVIEFERYM